ncbi:BTB/POZ protein [Glomus cerebriforme]|uniref:BTB/POZ protein n=1 Tax=Glomus cerebriforme TaxID=658196 RepID=A0A397T7J5_9GLOM|nr:BTB/POZ protein [Glomus cerebriforme]
MSTELSNILLEEYKKILESGEFSDIEILVGKEPNTKTFRLHSFVLKVCSPYFRIALSSDWTRVENNNIIFRKENISVEVFEIITKYIYGGQLELESNDVKTNIELLVAADELCLDELSSYTEEFLLNNKESLKSNLALILHIITQYDQFTDLTQFYRETYRQDPSLIFRSRDFHEIKQEYLLELLIRNEHSLRPIEIWDKLIEWVVKSNELPLNITLWTNDNVTTFGTLIRPFLSYINFEGISRTDFAQKVRPFRNIFDDQFYIRILESCLF